MWRRDKSIRLNLILSWLNGPEIAMFQNEVHHLREGLKNGHFTVRLTMSSTPPIYRYPWILWHSSSKQKGRIGDNSWMKMTFFLCKICFRTHTVPSVYPNSTRYPIFLSIPDPTRISFGNHRVAGNPKHRVLPDISGKPEVLGTTRYFGYHSWEENNTIIRCSSWGPTKRTPGCKKSPKSAILTSSMNVELFLVRQ